MFKLFLLIFLDKIVCSESNAPPDGLLTDGKAGAASRAEDQNNALRTRARLTRAGPGHGGL